MADIDFNEIEIRPTKHCTMTWLRKWGWGIEDLRKCLANAYSIDKVGKNKYEAYCACGVKSRKVIFAKIDASIVVITCAEGTNKV